MVAATTSYPRSTSSAAATELSTPPDMATRTRSFTVPPHPSAEWGMRNAEYKGRVESRNETRAAIPHSALRTPHSGFGSSVQDRGQCPDLVDNLGERADDRLYVFQRVVLAEREPQRRHAQDRKSTRLNSSHVSISYAVFCLKKKKKKINKTNKKKKKKKKHNK